MSRYLYVPFILIVTLLFTSALMAAEPENKGPQNIKLKMGGKTIDFTHHKHQKLTDNKCWECHADKNGQIDNWGKETAHKLCIPCHDLHQKGPVSCKSCHPKK